MEKIRKRTEAQEEKQITPRRNLGITRPIGGKKQKVDLSFICCKVLKMGKQISVKQVILTSFFVDFLDIAVNIFVALIPGSVVMLAELLQGVSDLIASGLLLIGLRRPKREAALWTLGSAIVMLTLASSLSFYFGLKRFQNPQEITNLPFAYTGLLIGLVSNSYAFLLSAKRILKGKTFSALPKAFKNSRLIMTKNTFVLDLMGASAALVGLIALILYQTLGEIKFDGLGAMGIGTILALLSLNLILNIKNKKGKVANKEV